jgi:tetratricopeptide (TPR) repeat protein
METSELTHVLYMRPVVVVMKNSAISEHPLLSEELLSTLREHIGTRRIAHGLSRLACCEPIFESFNPSLNNAAAFLGSLAQWCDIGFGSLDLLKRLLATYDPDSRSRLSVREYVDIRMADGVVAMTAEMFDKAVNHFDIVLKLAEEVNAWDVLSIAYHWKAGCLRKKGQYQDALAHIKKARTLQTAHGQPQNEAPARVLESLILFEMGETRQAVGKLRDAEVILNQTDDYVTLGNIQSTYGRIMQRDLRYAQAIEHYERAIHYFQKRDLKHAHIARALIDMSVARIQVAQYLRKNIETLADSAPGSGQCRPARALRIRELSKLNDTILADLDRAAQIYQQHPNARGIARVHLWRGHLYLDMGNLDCASEEASKAFASAESKRDLILMASARNLQCMVENAEVDEEVEGWAEHAVASRDYAEDAVKLASGTQDRRLLANVYIWQGLTLSSDFFNARDRARDAMTRAATYLEPGVHDFIWDNFQTLKRRLADGATLEPKLMQWAHGEVGDRSFRQLEEDFADLIIPRVWDQEKRKVSRAASRLSISPKKVRRVLNRLELLETKPHVNNKQKKPRRNLSRKGVKKGQSKSKPASRGRNGRADVRE